MLRHILLVVGLLMAAEHARNLYSLQQRSARTIHSGASGEASLLVRNVQQGFRQALNSSEQPPKQAFATRMTELSEEKGLRFVSIHISRTEEVWEWGTSKDVEPPDVEDLSTRGKLRVVGKGRYAMSWPPIALPEKHALRQLKSKPPRGEGEDLPHSKGPPPGGGPGFGPPGSPDMGVPPHMGNHSPTVMFVEFDPQETATLQNRLNWTLVLGVIGLLFMILGSVYAWWLIGRRERLQEEVQRKRLLASLGEMSAVISHELRNPLAAAMGQAELLEAYLEEGRAQDKARRISHELGRLEELANDLLAFVNSGRIALEEVDLKPTLEVILRALHNERLHVHYAHDLPEQLVCDPAMLGRAVDNIVDNALKISEETGGRVDVKFVREREHLRIEVEDEGPGLPEGVDVFKPFVTTREKGTGLGLAITSEIVYAHQGKISAENRQDRQGARFIICIPLHLQPGTVSKESP